MNSFDEKTIKSHLIYEGKIITVQVDDVELPNGKQAKRELVKHPGAVAVIAITEDNKLLLVRQYRKALEKEIFEIPAGKLESGESPAQCAERELKEETGFSASSFSMITSFYTSPGFADEIIYIYEATNLTKGAPLPDDDEFVEVIEVSLEEAQEMLKKQQIHDAKTAYAVQYWLLKTWETNRL